MTGMRKIFTCSIGGMWALAGSLALADQAPRRIEVARHRCGFGSFQATNAVASNEAFVVTHLYVRNSIQHIRNCC